MALIAPVTAMATLWGSIADSLYGDMFLNAVQCAQSSWDISPATTIATLSLASIGLLTHLRILLGLILLVCQLFGIEIAIVKVPIQVAQVVRNNDSKMPFQIHCVPTSDSYRWHIKKACSILTRENVAKSFSYTPCKVCALGYWPK